jgi:5-methylcytosine-specific restriction endonuclease McrA
MSITPETRQRLFQRAGGRCECEMECEEHKGKRCNRPLGGTNWEAHHKTSVAAGGSDDLGNLLAMCITCHRKSLSAT